MPWTLSCGQEGQQPSSLRRICLAPAQLRREAMRQLIVEIVAPVLTGFYH